MGATIRAAGFKRAAAYPPVTKPLGGASVGVDAVLDVAVEEESENPPLAALRSFSHPCIISSSVGTFSTCHGLELPSVVGGREGKFDSPMDGGLAITFFLLLVLVVVTLTPALPWRVGLPDDGDSSFPFLRFDVPLMLCWLLLFGLFAFVLPPGLLLLLPLLLEDRFFLELLFPPLLAFTLPFDPLLLLRNWGGYMVDKFGLKTTEFGVRGLVEATNADDLSLALTESPEGNFAVRSFIMTLNISSLEFVSNVTNQQLCRSSRIDSMEGQL
mmetsp:Transcript_3930/g.8450  ORF Transcript_3930/g.8450 Transcript_3930/m.8450 type:complete len:271 (+) Transcript_3930:1097-1909(+)